MIDLDPDWFPLRVRVQQFGVERTVSRAACYSVNGVTRQLERTYITVLGRGSILFTVVYPNSPPILCRPKQILRQGLLFAVRRTTCFAFNASAPRAEHATDRRARKNQNSSVLMCLTRIVDITVGCQERVVFAQSTVLAPVA